jgi:peptide/nickel transport system permease protein
MALATSSESPAIEDGGNRGGATPGVAQDRELTPRRSRGLYVDAWRRLLASWNGRIGLAVVLFLVLVAVLTPIIDHYDARTDSNLAESRRAPSAQHLFGTDRLGRDVARRIAHGAQISLAVGIMVVLWSSVVGTTFGLIAGYFGGPTDTVLMRIMDILLAFPAILLAISIVAVRGPGLTNTMIAVAIVGIPGYSRVTRSMVLSLKQREFVVAARMVGAGNQRIMSRHILPNCLSPLIVQATLGIGGAILFAAALGFLGLGAQPPAPEWGAMIGDAIPFLRTSPHMVFFPGMAIMIVVLGFNLLGDGLRDALDPQVTTR